MNQLFIIGYTELINPDKPLLMYVEAYLCDELRTTMPILITEYQIRNWQKSKDTDDWVPSVRINDVIWRLHIYFIRENAYDEHNENQLKFNSNSRVYNCNEFLDKFYEHELERNKPDTERI